MSEPELGSALLPDDWDIIDRVAPYGMLRDDLITAFATLRVRARLEALAAAEGVVRGQRWGTTADSISRSATLVAINKLRAGG